MFQDFEYKNLFADFDDIFGAICNVVKTVYEMPSAVLKKLFPALDR